MPKPSKFQNKLRYEKSPYLLQHADNPVNWFPWCDEAFDKALNEDKPIFLSVGYSTCHWCHIMERESFNDTEVAGILNRYFISIKVDREERPDIDLVYMNACQIMTENCGWPLTIIMTPDQKPFFAGSYFPKRSIHNISGFIDILEAVTVNWKEHKKSLLDIVNQVVTALKYRNNSASGTFSEKIIHKAFENLKVSFDDKYGGFGQAPKFPRAHDMLFLLSYHKKYNNSAALYMVEKTLQSMYKGGIYDHVGFGFSRYSTDNKWLVPHFEKMLYNNAMLAIAYSKAYETTKNELYAEVADNILKYTTRDMLDSDGGFYSAEDADSENIEGKFYVWSYDEIIEVLGQKDGELFCKYYGVTEEGNFEGKNILNLINADINDSTLKYLKQHCIPKLFNARKKRTPLYKDDKILTSWNGLMIAALAIAARVLKKEYYSKIAAKATDFISQNLTFSDGMLLARFRDGEAKYLAYIDDYAFLVWGLIELHRTTSQEKYLKKALELTNKMIELFWDNKNGGFFFYSNKSEQLITRPKEIYDGALPSGNSAATLNLVRLANAAGSKDLLGYVNKQLSAFAGSIERHPHIHSFFLLAFLILYSSDIR